MFTLDELKNNDKFKELDESVLDEILKVGQEKGDLVKDKYTKAEKELNEKLEATAKELEDAKKDVEDKKPEGEGKGGNKMDEQMLEQFTKLQETIEGLTSKVQSMESKESLTDTRTQVLKRAKEEGRDLEKVKAYIDRLGENLTVDENLELFPKTQAGSATDPSSVEGDDDNFDGVVETGNAEFDKLINGE